MKIELCSLWINVHTQQQCSVESKCFYNIGIQNYTQLGEVDGGLMWIHYKIFIKHWRFLGT